jgi:hypothetical protein
LGLTPQLVSAVPARHHEQAVRAGISLNCPLANMLLTLPNISFLIILSLDP